MEELGDRRWSTLKQQELQNPWRPRRSVQGRWRITLGWRLVSSGGSHKLWNTISKRHQVPQGLASYSNTFPFSLGATRSSERFYTCECYGYYNTLGCHCGQCVVNELEEGRLGPAAGVQVTIVGSRENDRSDGKRGIGCIWMSLRRTAWHSFKLPGQHDNFLNVKAH